MCYYKKKKDEEEERSLPLKKIWFFEQIFSRKDKNQHIIHSNIWDH